MTINKLAMELCKREGKKKQVDIAQMKEIVGHLSDIFYERYDDTKGNLTNLFYYNGKRRAMKAKAKRKRK